MHQLINQNYKKADKFTLVKTNYHHSVSMDLYHEFENAFLGSNNWEIVNSISSIAAMILSRFFKYFHLRLLPVYKNKCYLIIGYQKEKFFPHFHYTAPLKALWIYDAWEPLYHDIEESIRRYKINLLFTSSRQSTLHFNSFASKDFQAHWIPEAVDPDCYLFREYRERTIDILQFGRKWDAYHEKIKPLESKFNYLYEKSKGEIVFKTRSQFINGLANSKISICIPSNITHPGRSGNVSTLTSRYLQSMASKCLIIGKSPDEMPYLFDYEPIIEIDEKEPQLQIQTIIENYNAYLPLIERNYKTVKTIHTWANRVSAIETIMRNYINSES